MKPPFLQLSQMGLASSHFFFRPRQVWQPVLVRLLKFRFLRFGSLSLGSPSAGMKWIE